MPAPEKVVDVTRDPGEMINEILELCREYLPGIGKPTDHFLQQGRAPGNLDLLRQALTEKVGAQPRYLLVQLKDDQDAKMIANVVSVAEYAPGCLAFATADGATTGLVNVLSWKLLPASIKNG